MSTLLRPGPSNHRDRPIREQPIRDQPMRDEPRRRRRSASSDGPLIKLVSTYGPRSSAEDGSQDDGDGYQTGDEFALTRDDRRPRYQRSQPQSRSEPYWNNRDSNSQHFDRNNRKRNWGQIGAREHQRDHGESSYSDHRDNRTRNDNNDRYDDNRDHNNRYENSRDHDDRFDNRRDQNYSQRPKKRNQSCQSCEHCGCNASLNEPRSRNRYQDREYEDSTDDDNNDYYDPRTRYHENRNRNLPPRRKRRNDNQEDFHDRNPRGDGRPADFQRRNQRDHGNSSRSILQDARGARDGARGRFHNRLGRNIHVSRSKNDDFDQSEGENHREMDNSFDESPMTHDGAQLG